MNLLGNQRNDTKNAYINQVNYLNQAKQADAAAYNTRQQAKAARISSLLNTAISMYGVSKTFGGTASKTTGQLHHPSALAGIPETMEDQVFAVTKYKPQKFIGTKSPYSWLR